MQKYLFFITFLFSSLLSANTYNLKVTDANHHLAEVDVVFTGVSTRTLVVKLPVWRSGKYKILDLSKNIRNFRALDAKDNELTWEKTDKNTWKIFVNTPNIVRVKYQVYANQLRQRVAHIDATHAFLDASGVFMYSESHRNKPLTVQLNVPQQWRSVSGLESIGKHAFKAEDYDQLVDSPIESGVHQFDSFKVDQQEYEIVIWGEGNFDLNQIKVDIEKLHHQAKAIWGEFPYKRYVFIYHVGDNLRGATEHVNSTIIQADRFNFRPEDNYHKIIGTTAHELIHTWNVKAYRPAGISPYNYSKENYSDLYWMAEGKTSYYDNLFNLRAEIYTVKQYLENMAKDIQKYQNKPGRKVMSLSQASFDTWLDNSTNRIHNTTVSIYLKGSLVSWLLDKEIRQLTKNKKNLDDLSRHLYQDYATNKNGYSSYNVKQLLKKITAHNFDQFWSEYVEGTKEINFNQLLDFYGLKFKAQDNTEQAKLSLGILSEQKSGLTVLSIVDAGGPAWEAGLTVGDAIIAINGIQINDNLDQHIENLELDQQYTVHYFNHGKLKKTTIKPINARPEKLEIISVTKPTKLQKKHFNSWSKHDILTSF